MNMGKWSDKDTAKESSDSPKEVARAEHNARDDATKAGVFERGNDKKNSTPFSRDDESGQKATGFWKSVFRKGG